MNPMPLKCPRCGVERETLDTRCLICYYKPEPQAKESQSAAAQMEGCMKDATPSPSPKPIDGYRTVKRGSPADTHGNLSTINNVKDWIGRNRIPCTVTVAVIVVASMAFAFKPKDQVSTRTNLFAHKQPARLAFKEDRQLEEQLESQLESVKNEFQEVKDALDDVQYSLSSLKMEVDDFFYDSENWRNNVRDVEDATRRLEMAIDDLESAISDVDSEL
jgi:uncharacterized protein HemX